MPYYYLISEVPDSTDEPIYDARTYQKPETYNLLLPSIHASREDNILDTTDNAEEAVRNLQASCKDSESWPSSEYCSIAENTKYHFPRIQTTNTFDSSRCNENDPSLDWDPVTRLETAPKPPVLSKYRLPFWEYDSIRPDLLEAARALFYERKRHQMMYAGISSWSYSSGPSRYPTDYELFTAWASLPRSEKLAFVSEVSGPHSSNLIPSDSLSTQRAVTSLLASCPDSCSWPSFQFSRIQAQQRPYPLQHHPRYYQQQHHFHPKAPMFQNPLPFKLD